MYNGLMEQKKEKMKDDIYLAWHIEAFQRSKKLPSLDKLYKDIDKNYSKNRTKKKTNKSDADLFKIAKSKGLQVPDKV